ncbi:hypothetical protein [Sphingobacterium faecium]|uniref:hypothetical protein n=1 Tax=Sphingobacterium faecium TaxID=34087 RepID=UPI003209E144
MKIIPKIIKAGILMAITTFLFSCQKDEGVGTVDIAKVNVINAVVGGGEAKVNIGTGRIPWSSVVDDQILGGPNGVGRLYITPTDRSSYLQVVPVDDTTKFWYNQQQQLAAGKMYTLYLSGTAREVKTSFHEETNFPKYILRDAGYPTPVKDSIVNIRFVNLSPSGPQVDINVQGKSSNEVSGLNYEEFSEFKTFPFTKNGNFMTFEIRKSSDKMLITRYSLYVPNVRFKSIAIIMIGVYEGVDIPYMDQYRVDMVVYQ